MQKGTIGKLGEDEACKYLQGKRYNILTRNYRKKYGEIDIIAIAPDKTLVFVEVKTMTANDSVSSLVPEDQMSSAKLRKSRRIAQMFAASHLELIQENKGWRVDLLAILVSNIEKEEPNFTITHYENV